MKWILTILFLPLVAFASIKSDIDQLIKKTDKAINIGVEVQDLTTGKLLYQKNANRWFTPASNMKLYSDAAALIMLGPDYRFPTQLLTDAKQIKHKHLQGNLYIVSHGSPVFTHQNLIALLGNLKQFGIKTIGGNIIVVNQSFKAKPQAPGWMVDDMSFGYGSPITPISLDANRVEIIINPGAKSGDKALVEPQNSADAITITSDVETVAKPANCRFSYAMDSHNHLTVTGCIGRDKLAQHETVAVKNPIAYFRTWTKLALLKQGIRLKGKVIAGVLPDQTLLLSEHLSQPLRQIIASTLKPSDNLYADSLFLKVGQVYFKRKATWRMAQVAIKKVLQKYTGINLDHAVLADGSGLSRYDLITPHQTVQLLRAMHFHFPIAYEFAAALPIAGRDGTLQRRLIEEGQKDLIRAKTGSMLGVVSLSGYLRTTNQHVLAFSILINGISGNSHRSLMRYRQLEDNICDYFLKLKPSTVLHKQAPAPKYRVLPYERKYSHLQLKREKKRTLNNLEFHLKKAMANEPIIIKRQQKQLMLSLPTNLTKFKKKLGKLANHYDFWIELKGRDEAKLKALGFSKALLNINSRYKNQELVIHLQS